jgi:nucleotide-binding universal stress UspA family protein
MAQSAIVRWSNPKVILVATNLFEGYPLIMHAIYQAKLSHAKVLLVHVIPFPRLISEATNGLPIRLQSPLVRSVKAKLEETASDFRREGIECEPIVLEGATEEEIPLLVKSRGVDRVIVATRNASGIARLVGVSVVEELVAGLEAPVCIVGRRNHPGAACNTPLGHILLATTLHLDSLLLAGIANALAESNHSRLTLLHVLNTEGMSELQRESALAMTQRRLCALVPNQSAHRVPPIFLVREGDPATIILREAGSRAQDLIVLGSPHPSMASWVLDTSVVRRVVTESQCPVIVIRPTMQATTEYLQGLGDAEVTLGNSGESAGEFEVSKSIRDDRTL